MLCVKRISRFLGFDVIVSAAALLALPTLDGESVSPRQRLRIALTTCSVGVSFGLPLYMLPREPDAVTARR